MIKALSGGIICLLRGDLKMIKIAVSNSELNRLNNNFAKHAKKINEASSLGLNRIALQVLAKAQANIKDKDGVVTGQLINSGRVLPKRDFTIDVNFTSAHASAYEFGRKSGKMPPIEVIEQWLKKRGALDTYLINTQKQKKRGADFEKKLKSVAFLIARAIGRVGTKGKPFLYPAMRDSENDMINVLKKSIKEVL